MVRDDVEGVLPLAHRRDRIEVAVFADDVLSRARAVVREGRGRIIVRGDEELDDRTHEQMVSAGACIGKSQPMMPGHPAPSAALTTPLPRPHTGPHRPDPDDPDTVPHILALSRSAVTIRHWLETKLDDASKTCRMGK